MINALCATSTPGTVVTGSDDGSLALYDAALGRVLHRWLGHSKPVNALAWSARGETAFSVSRDLTLRAWRRSAGAGPTATVTTPHTLSPSALAACADATVLATGGRDYRVLAWDVNTLTSTWAAPELTQNVVTCLAWLPGAPALLLQGSEDCTLRLWDVRTRTRTPAVAFPRAAHFALACAAFDAAPGLIASAGNGFCGDGCATTLWDARVPRALATIAPFSDNVGYENDNDSGDCNNNGNGDITDNGGSTAGEWGEPQWRDAAAHHEAVSACAFLPGGDNTASASGASASAAGSPLYPRLATAGRDGELVWGLPLRSTALQTSAGGGGGGVTWAPAPGARPRVQRLPTSGGVGGRGATAVAAHWDASTAQGTLFVGTDDGRVGAWRYGACARRARGYGGDDDWEGAHLTAVQIPVGEAVVTRFQ